MVDAFDDQEFEAVVSEVSSAGTASGGITTYDVTLELQSNMAFKVALTISAEVHVQSVSDVVCIPSSAVKTLGGKSSLYIMAQ